MGPFHCMAVNSMSASSSSSFGTMCTRFGIDAQITDVEEAVMGGTVVAGEASAIHAEDHRQILQADVVHDRDRRRAVRNVE